MMLQEKKIAKKEKLIKAENVKRMELKRTELDRRRLKDALDGWNEKRKGRKKNGEPGRVGHWVKGREIVGSR